MSKSLFLSKTFWANILGVIVGVGGYASGLVPAEYHPLVVSGMAFLNVLLRYVSNEAVHLISSDER